MFFLSLFLSFSYAKEASLFTSSVTYCEPPESLLIEQFEIAYFAKNESVSFNISAASVQANVNVTANLLLNVYGIHAVNVTLDLCDIFNGALCPLPMYNFTGSDSISLPKSLAVQEKIPNIAFTIPDLEGVAQLVLTEVGTGKVKACVQATLSNGWSAHQTSVEWVTGSIAFATLLVSIWQSLSLEAILPFRFIDLLFLYQTIASTSLLSLNYPSVYRAFTLNFAWAVGLFSTPPTSSFQPSIDRMRHLTGGNLANATSASAVGLVNRKLSPYNLIISATQVSSHSSRRTADFSATWAKFMLSDFPTSFRSTLASATQGTDVQTVTTSSSNVLQAGIPIYVNTLHIATANAFMTVFLCSLIFLACALVVFILGLVVILVLGRVECKTKFERVYLLFAQAWGIRLALILFLPVTVFSFYQWTLKDSWLSTLLSVLAFMALLITVIYVTFVVLRSARRRGADALFADKEQLGSKGPLYSQYRIPRFHFFMLLLIATFLKAVFIAFVKVSGEAQIILMIILEGFTLMSYLIFRPCGSRSGDVFSTFLTIARLVSNGLMIAFVERLNVAPIPRTVIGLVLVVIFSLTILITYVNLVINSGIDQLWKRRHSSASQSSADLFIIEKDVPDKSDNTLSHASSSEHIMRPANPTPDGSDYIVPHLHPSPVSPTETEMITSAYTSNRTSGTMTVGSLLSRRWSFSPLHSPTGSFQVHESSSVTLRNDMSR
ncbi:Flavin carrier protein 2 [Termitomyces sp. J132]|nr:Flavin carrier protein 2 [Termitomyces sp. J132]